MNIMKRIILFSLFMSCSLWLAAQQGMPRDQIAAFQKQVCSEPEQAIKNFILPLTENAEVIENFRSQFAFLQDNYGACNGFEIFETKEYSPSVQLYKCFFKYQRTPVIFKFIFYKYRDTWELNSVNFSDNISEELGEDKN